MIHYHGAPMSGPLDYAARFFRGRHAFVSFASPEQLGIIADVCQSFALDNGAFTQWKRGRKVDVEAYMDWVRTWDRHPGFDWAVIPDDIEGSESDNDRLLSAWDRAGIGHGVPVWHMHESIERLQALCLGYPIVALGSSGQWPVPGKPSWWERMGDALRSVCDDYGRPMCRLHGLRMLDPEVFSRMPLASADSTNAARNGAISSKWRTYSPPEVWQRANVVADRIESHNSAPLWEALV